MLCPQWTTNCSNTATIVDTGFFYVACSQLSRLLSDLVYTTKVPTYNYACKCTMFFLHLPLDKTLETPEQVKHFSNRYTENSKLHSYCYT